LRVTVKVDGHDYEVELGDLAARPIVATIDGTSYEVWPEVEHVAAKGNGNGAHPALAQTVTIAQPAVPARVPPPSPAPTNEPGAPRNGNTASEVRAPLPGVIVSVKARPGMKVNVGDELLVLEAMKMKNAVRATRAGTVSEVAVTEGQTVKHSQVLLRYEG
jgi:biotin carboxyl carrier protein